MLEAMIQNHGIECAVLERKPGGRTRYKIGAAFARRGNIGPYDDEGKTGGVEAARAATEIQNPGSRRQHPENLLHLFPLGNAQPFAVAKAAFFRRMFVQAERT